MKNLLLFIIVVSIFGLINCETTKNENEQIYGKWQAISWEAAGVETLGEGTTVHFEFKNDDTYTALLGSAEETGIYRLANKHLYTTAKGQIEKMVEIELNSVDTMVMNMNRAGTAEVMTLVKME